MDIRQLRYFACLCEQKNFCAAANKLYLTPQALSKSMKRMEEEMGVQLLLRNSDGVTLTPAAEYLLTGCQGLINQFDALIRETQQVASQHETLRICLSYGVMRSVLHEFLGAFKAQYPLINLHMEETDDSGVEQMVLDRHVQIGFTVGLPIAAEQFHVQAIKHEPLYFFAHRDNALSCRKSIAIADLKGQRFLAVTENFKTFRLIENKCRQQGFLPEYAVKTMDLTLLGYLLSINEGIAIGPDHQQLDLVNNHLVRLPMSDPEMQWSVYMITRRGEGQTPAQKQFTKAAKRYGEQHFLMSKGRLT